MTEIVNRVKESGLISLDLADFKPSTEIVAIDIAKVLWQGLVLKEKDFREWVRQHDWSSYANKAVYIHCSAEAVVPTWAYMLIASQLQDQMIDFIVGSKLELEKEMIRRNIRALSARDFIDGRVIIKGCSDISAPEYAMVELVKFLQPHVKSIMYGEPCSTVPVFKRKK